MMRCEVGRLAAVSTESRPRPVFLYLDKDSEDRVEVS
jgi:hypothetical protein